MMIDVPAQPGEGPVQLPTPDASIDNQPAQPEEGPVQLPTPEVLPQQPVIIRQTMDGNLVVTYEIKSSDGSAFTETVKLPLSELTDDVNSWDPAKKYTYTVTIGTSEILIDPVVAEWDDVTATIDRK